MAYPVPKSELLEIVQSLPEDATWEDLQYFMYVREKIERGRRSAREKPLRTQEEVFARYQLDR